jgi:hypothetical protein
MTRHSSASVREHTSHAIQTTRTNTIISALKRRAQAVLNDTSIDPQSRAIIRYALETHDPWLAELVRRAYAGETLFDNLDFEATTEMKNDEASEEEIEVLTDMICRGGDAPETKATALVVLMAAVENSAHPKADANAVKHRAFSLCAEMSLYGTIDAQVEMLERELFADTMRIKTQERTSHE